MSAADLEPKAWSPSAGGERPRFQGASRLAQAMVATTLVLVAMGAMVTSTGSGLAFADWPLSDGEWMPERALQTLPGFLEHFHRILGALVGAMVLALTLWIGRTATDLPWLRRLCIGGLGVTVVQGVFGGVGVRLGLPVFTSTTHGVLAQVTLATYAAIAHALSPRGLQQLEAPGPALRSGRRMAVLGLAVLLLQTLIGALARHSHSVTALWLHVANALVVFILLILVAGLVAGRLGQLPGIGRSCRLVMILLVLQVALGFVALLVRTGKHPENIRYLWRASLISTHVLVGALLTFVVALLLARLWLGVRPAAGEAVRG